MIKVFYNIVSKIRIFFSLLYQVVFIVVTFISNLFYALPYGTK